VLLINILPQVQSVYSWEGKLNVDAELLLIVKSSSSASRLQALREAVKAVHPYELPEIIHLPVTAGLDGYVEWVNAGSGGRP
jgi:periplasmic divalent cation tolerance protein